MLYNKKHSHTQCGFLEINPIGAIMSTPGSMPDRPSKETTSVQPVVLYHERFHLKYFFVGSKLPAVLVVVSIFFLWLFYKATTSASVAGVTEPPADTTHVDGGKLADMLSAIVQVAIDTISKMLKAIVDILPIPDVSWLPLLQIVWWLFLVWAIARSWFRWFKSYAEVTTNDFTIHTPKSFWFALGAKGNRSVPAWMIYDADEASSIVDNTLYAKTVSRVNVFIRDTAGQDDAMAVNYARHAKELIQSLKFVAQFNAPAKR